MRSTGKEFMPALNEGSFLLMPTSLPHAGVEENKREIASIKEENKKLKEENDLTV